MKPMYIPKALTQLARMLFLIMATTTMSLGQAVGISETGAAPNAKSILDVSSIEKGLLVPRMTSAQRALIAAGATEEGMIVYDTNLKRYMLYNGLTWQKLGEGLWLEDANGINRTAAVGIGTTSLTRHQLYVHRANNYTGADTTNIYAFRSGSSGNSTGGGGTSFAVAGIDAAIKGYSFWGNPYSAGIAAYSFLDYNNSAALVAAKQDASVMARLALKDGSGVLWSGYFTGNARFDGQVGVGVSPGSFANFHSQTASFLRSGYFYNSMTSAETTFAIYAGAFGTGSGDKRGGSFDASGGTGTNIAIRANAVGGTTNWAGYFAAGNVYVLNNLYLGDEGGATGYRLSVDGKIMCEELKVQNSTSWPDFVFSENYDLMSIKVLDQHIKEHQHLPGIPSAAQLADEGIMIGDMQKRMMQKIEELTLYIIAQDKRITELEEKANSNSNSKKRRTLIR